MKQSQQLMFKKMQVKSHTISLLPQANLDLTTHMRLAISSFCTQHTSLLET